jgi:hypothetical protein
LDGGGQIEEKPIVVDAHFGSGNVLLFANNPIYRGETIGSYGLVMNAILNFDHLARTGRPGERASRRAVEGGLSTGVAVPSR